MATDRFIVDGSVTHSTSIEGRWLMKTCRSAESLGDDDSQVREAACHLVGAMQYNKHIPEVVALLQDKVADVRRSALWALGVFGPSCQRYADEVECRLSDTNEDVRRAAAWALGRLNLATYHERKQIIRIAAKDRYSAVRRELAAMLAKRPAGDQEVLSQLRILQQEDPDVWVRSIAAKARYEHADRLLSKL